jgi:signal transduction histidine kinase
MNIKYFTLILVFSISISSQLFADDFNTFKSRFDSLLANNNDSLFIETGLLIQKSKENSRPDLEALARMNMGLFYMRKMQQEKAIQQFFLAEKLFIKVGIKEYLGFIYSNVGAAYRHAKDYQNARNYFTKSIENISNKDRKQKAQVWNRLGDIQRDLGLIDSAFISYFTSLSIAEKNDYAVFANNYNNLGDLHKLSKNYDSSLYYYNFSISYIVGADSIENLAENHSSIAHLNSLFNKPKGIIDNITKSIYLLEGKSTNFELYNSYSNAVEIYAKLDIKDSLIKYLHKLLELELTTQKERYTTNMLTIELEHVLDQKEHENNLLKSESKFQTLVNYLLVAIVILVILAGILLFIQIRNKKKENRILIEQKEAINKAKDKLQTAYNDIHELNATKDKFFSIIAHDLRNPLGSFRSITQMMLTFKDDMPAEEHTEFLELIKKSADSVYNLLENLLEWSRSQRGQIKLNISTFDLNKVIENTINLASLTAKNKGIQITYSNKGSSQIKADYELLNTILRNITSNAIKFTPQNGKISINVESNKSNHTIAVKDNGIGMTKEVIDQLFRIDVSVTTLGTSTEKGSGLGLILCKEFVELHGGKIWVESEPNVGSSFYFSIPV